MLTDIHGDLASLTLALAEAERLSCDEIWVLGDLVGDGDNAAVVDLVRREAAVVVAGNHDLTATGLADPSWEPAHRAELMRGIRLSLDTAALGWLAGLPVSAERWGVSLAHVGYHQGLKRLTTPSSLTPSWLWPQPHWSRWATATARSRFWLPAPGGWKAQGSPAEPNSTTGHSALVRGGGGGPGEGLLHGRGLGPPPRDVAPAAAPRRPAA